jgi:hypothetical protein
MDNDSDQPDGRQQAGSASEPHEATGNTYVNGVAMSNATHAEASHLISTSGDGRAAFLDAYEMSRHLRLLDPDAETFIFASFDDDKERAKKRLASAGM